MIVTVCKMYIMYSVHRTCFDLKKKEKKQILA